MTKSARLAVPHSVVLVEDASGGDIPESMHQSVLASTASCIAIGCRSEVDGETRIELQDYDLANTDRLVFDGVLRTKSRELIVRTVLGEVLLQTKVPKIETELRVWVNDAKEPDHITIGVKQ